MVIVTYGCDFGDIYLPDSEPSEAGEGPNGLQRKCANLVVCQGESVNGDGQAVMPNLPNLVVVQVKPKKSLK